MLILVKFIAIVIVGMGILFLLSPKITKPFIGFWKQGKRLYIAGILRISFGIIFLLAASECRLVGIIVALGILFLIGGILIFMLGLERLKSILNWLDRRSFLALRFIGLAVIAIGALVLYSV